MLRLAFVVAVLGGFSASIGAPRAAPMPGRWKCTALKIINVDMAGTVDDKDTMRPIEVWVSGKNLMFRQDTPHYGDAIPFPIVRETKDVLRAVDVGPYYSAVLSLNKKTRKAVWAMARDGDQDPQIGRVVIYDCR